MTQPASEPLIVHVWAEGKRTGLDGNEGYELNVNIAGVQHESGHYILQAEDGSWATFDSTGKLVATADQRGRACGRHARTIQKRINE